jgi:hypothetical protein
VNGGRSSGVDRDDDGMHGPSLSPTPTV